MIKTTGKEILLNYLKMNDYDGLCHPDTECGCGLDDLIGPCDGMQEDCKPAYNIRHPDGGNWFTIHFDHRPSEEDIEEYWKFLYRESVRDLDQKKD